MKITIVPFNYVRAFVDVENLNVYIGINEIHKHDIGDLIKHEFAHYITQDPDHGTEWQKAANEIVEIDHFKTLRKRCGISSHIAANIGNISGIQNILTDYHLLQAYRRFSQKVLGTEGHWEVLGEVDGGPGDQLIRLYPTPKGAFPVVVLYMPVVNHFRSPNAKLIAHEMLLAEAKIMVGHARRKITGIPMPDGSTLTMDGEALVQEGREEKERLIDKAISLAEPMHPAKW